MTEKEVTAEIDKLLEDFKSHLNIKINRVRYQIFYDIKGPPGLEKPYKIDNSTIIDYINKYFGNLEAYVLNETEELKSQKDKMIGLLQNK